ncbi:MAG: NADH-quinone oxidoreductase subunit L, partial [Propionibacteriales bacterium]|nr:NADH-quinone oxidoreductase subunit L [Propionibacteriales bacterium]
NYGGLARYMPITFATFAAGYLAIIGFPFFAGYYSKDHIIEAAFEHNQVVGALAMVGAGVTAFYMTRLVMMTFLGRKRWDEGVHPHESPAVMTIPLIVLGLASVAGGLLLNGWISGWLAPAVGGGHGEGSAPQVIATSPVAWITLAVVAVGVVIGFLAYRPGKDVPKLAPQTHNPLVIAGRHDLFGDAFNETMVVAPGQVVSRAVLATDRYGVDGAVTGSAQLVGGLSVQLRKLQNGFVRSYALMMVVGTALLGAVLVLSQLG